ncbi:MAG: AgmX/PglI C-terminal domain-containing protein, partial [Polyangiales bacterium]
RFTLGADAEKGITVQVARVAAAKKLISKRNLKRGIFAIALGSFAAHAAIVAALAYSPGASLDEDTSPLDKETSAHMISLYKNADMRELPQQEETVAPTQGNAGGEDGQAHKGAGGQMGSLAAKATNAAYTVKGPPETQEEHLANVRAMIDRGELGALGAMKSVFGTMNGPTDLASAFDDSLGHEAQNFDGNLMGDHPGDSFGYNGLGLKGTGWGGDGFGDGIGLGPIGGLGHGPGSGGFSWGNCSGDLCGATIGTTKKGLQRKSGGIKMFDQSTSVTGGYPREIVQRIVRANFPRLRACYDQGLKADPGLRGNVTTRFIIDQTGAVETASLSSSSLSSPAVAGCVVSVFNTMSFPAPETGKAGVSYPIDFDHADE